jgi:ATP synthase protein I
MQKETKEMLKELAYYSSLGFSVALSIFIGLAIGLFLDTKLGTNPWFMFIFLGLGIAAGFRNMLYAMKKSKNIK